MDICVIVYACGCVSSLANTNCLRVIVMWSLTSKNYETISGASVMRTPHYFRNESQMVFSQGILRLQTKTTISISHIAHLKQIHTTNELYHCIQATSCTRARHSNQQHQHFFLFFRRSLSLSLSRFCRVVFRIGFRNAISVLTECTFFSGVIKVWDPFYLISWCAYTIFKIRAEIASHLMREIAWVK